MSEMWTYVNRPHRDWWTNTCQSVVLWVTTEQRREIEQQDRAQELALLAANTAYEAKRMKRRARKAHSRACRLRWMAEQARASG